jgi:hypothetical protein
LFSFERLLEVYPVWKQKFFDLDKFVFGDKFAKQDRICPLWSMRISDFWIF